MQKKKVKVLIIDDEIEGIFMLKSLLDDIDDIEVADAANNAIQGKLFIQKHNPDLVFCDISMPGQTGIELALAVKESQLQTTFVFVTAYHEYAIQAIKLNAFDYLLKPVDPDDLINTINKYIEKHKASSLERKIDQIHEKVFSHKKLKFNNRTGFILINPDEIVYLKSSGNYTEIFLKNSNVELVTLQLGCVFDQLSDYGFIRISRFAAINIIFLKKFDKKRKICILEFNGKDTELCVSRSNFKWFENYF